MYMHEMKAGTRLETLSFRPTRELNEQFLFGLEDYHTRYVGNQAIVHPGLLLNMSNNTRSPSFELPKHWAEVHVMESTLFLGVALVGDKITIEWSVLEAHERHDRPWQVVDITIKSDADNRIIMKRKMTNTFVSPDMPMHSTQKPIFKRSDATVHSNGEKKLSRERVWAFSGDPFSPGWPTQNIHTDPGFAISVGLTKAYVSATQYLGHLVELMLSLYGKEWLHCGQWYDIRFTVPVSINDSVCALAQINVDDETSFATQIMLDVWGENQYGTQVYVGKAGLREAQVGVFNES